MTASGRSVACALALANMWFVTRYVAADSASMSLLAPGMASDKTRVEARVSIRNPAAQAREYRLEVFLDSSLGTETLTATDLAVPAQGQVLQTVWFPTTGLGGRNRVRYRVTPNNGTSLTGHAMLQVIASDTRAVPLITTAWIDPGAVLPGVYPQARAIAEQDVRDSVDAAFHVGIDTLIVTYPEYVLNGWGAFYPSASLPASAAGFDVVGAILNQASQNGQRVFVGLGRGDDLLLTWDGYNDPQRVSAGLAHGTTVANELWDLYAHEPSFFGWYLTHEANDIGPASDGFYNPMVNILRQFEADKPVMISPAGTPTISAQILASSHVDVFAYQDAVGAGYVPYVNTFDPQQRIDMLDSVFASYEATHANVEKHLWANLESWQMDGPSYANPYPADFERLLTQLNIEKNYVDQITSYEWLGFFEHPSSSAVLGGQRAVDLYEAYRGYVDQLRPTLKVVNHVVSPGFEFAGASTPTIEGWQFTGNGSTQTASTDFDTPTGTAAALRLDVDEPAGLPWLIQDVPITAGAEYQFSAWVKQLTGDPTGGHLAAQVWMLEDPTAAFILDSAVLFFDDPEWHYQSTPLTAPTGASVARIVFALQNSGFGPGTGTYLIDGVALVGPERVPGDFDGNGQVNDADYELWRASYGSSIDRRADGNGDLVVNAADFTVWQDARSPGGISAENTDLPEPMPWQLILAALAATGCTWRRGNWVSMHHADSLIVYQSSRAGNVRSAQ